MAHVALIRPALVASKASFSTPITPPLGLAYLASSLRAKGHRVTLVDSIAEGLGRSVVKGAYRYEGLGADETAARLPSDVDVIGVSCMFTQDWPYSREAVAAIRRRFPNVPLIAGGEHVTALPELVLRDCPEIAACALGEAEETVVELVEALASGGSLSHVQGVAFSIDGAVVRTAERKRIRAVDEIAAPAWDLLPMEAYLTCTNGHGVFRGRSMPILATRGCPYQCTFCSSPTMYGTTWLARDPLKVLDEIEVYLKDYKADNIDFYDLTMIVKRSWILEFCAEIERRGLKFSWQLPTGTRSEVVDEEVSAALYRTGCRNMTYAPESGSPDTLRAIKKRVNLDKVTASIRGALKNGLSIKASLIIGFPHETRRHVLESVRFALKLAVLGVQDVPIFLFSPYAGSELFRHIQAERYSEGLPAEYYESLVSFMDMTKGHGYCKNVSSRELSFWRFAGMALFYGVSFTLRPWRLLALVRQIAEDRSETILAQRAGAIWRRWRRA